MLDWIYGCDSRLYNSRDISLLTLCALLIVINGKWNINGYAFIHGLLMCMNSFYKFDDFILNWDTY